MSDRKLYQFTLSMGLLGMAWGQVIFAEELDRSPTLNPVVAPKPISQWIADLDDSNFRRRQEATQKLISAGREAVGPLTEAARQGNLEVGIRAVSILQANYVHGSLAAVDAAELALEELTASNNHPIASEAGAVLAIHYDIREKRAIAEIERLGGVIEYNKEQLIDPTNPGRIEKQIAFVLLGLEWKGGDEGLKHIKRMTRLTTLYFISGADVSEEALKDLQAELPQLNVQFRGRSYLGVSGAPHPRGCQILLIKPGSAAHKARLAQGDVITKFNGKEVPDFETLVDLIAETKPGDKVPVEVIRNAQTLMLTVEMGGWTNSD